MRPIQLYSLVDRRQRRKGDSARSMRRRLGRLGLGCATSALLVLVAGLLAASLLYASLVDGLPSLSLLPQLLDPQDGLLMQPTRVYDRSGQKLLYSLENPGISRRSLTLDASVPEHFSPELIRATIGALDPTFWQGGGFKLRSLTGPQPETIAERLVDDLLLWQEPVGLRRALRMRILAAQVTARYGHVRVLEWYLNSAYYGRLSFGADSAARLYLDRPASQLDLAGAALLVAASQAPALNPLDAPDAALERQRAVLDTLLVRGVISPEEHRRAVLIELPLARQPGPETGPADAFSRLALHALEDRFGRERLERGGMRVITTLDYALQLELTCLVRTQLSRLAGEAEQVNLPDGSACQSARLLPTLPPGSPALPVDTEASAAVFDPISGQVLALLGDTTVSGEENTQLSRPPGSLLTPFVALAGFARGSGPASLAWDIPTNLPAGLESYANPDGKYHGPVRLRTAIANDYLAPVAQLLLQMGPASVWRTSSALGLSGISDETSAELLYEGGRVSPLEIAQAYGVFAGMGTRAGQRFTPQGDLRPAMVLYVVSADGTILWDAGQPEEQAVVSPQLAYLVHHILADSSARWPSLGFPNPLEIGRPAGAKIGNVDGGRQVWVSGYTPQQVSVFWLGLPEEDDGGAVNARMAAGIWHAWMQYTSRGVPVTDWPQPAGISRVEVCDPSGLLPTDACPEVVGELFLNGNEPTAGDSLYRQYQINRETGRLATVFTPPVLVDEQTFLVVPPEASEWVRAAGLPLPPEAYDAIQPPEPDPDLQITGPPLFGFVRGEVEIRGTASGEGFRFFQVQVGQGLNPQTWLQVGPDGAEVVEDDLLALWDTQGQEGLYAVRLLIARSNQEVETAVIQVTVDNTAPLVRVTYPRAGQSFELAASPVITFQVEASDAIGVERLIWLVNGKQVGERLRPPYAFSWAAVQGTHSLEVRAYDLAGNESYSETVTFSVK